MERWNDLLRQARERLDWSQGELARRAGVSEKTVSNYELAARRPTGATLRRLLRALGPDQPAANAILSEAGFDPEPAGRLAEIEARRVALPQLQREVASYPWPCLVVNERHEIVGWNDPARHVAELEFSSLAGPRDRNLMRISAMKHFRDRVLNWDHVALTMMSILKHDQVDLARDDPGSQYYKAVLNDIMRDDSDVLLKLGALWNEAQPWHDGTRVLFEPVWRVSDGTVLRFTTIIRTWDDFDAAWANDWHPADAATWSWLAERAAQPPGTPDHGIAADGAPADEPVDWHTLLARGREGSGLTQRTLAEAVGVSVHAVSSYERGIRTPDRETLLRLTRALELDGVTTNAILASLGLDPEPSEWSRFMAGLPLRARAKQFEGRTHVAAGVATVQRAIDKHRWPCLVVNERCEIACWNDAAVRVFGLDFGRDLPDPRQRSFLRFALSRHMRDRVENWEQVATAVVPSTLKQVFPEGRNASAPPWLRAVLDDIHRDDPGIVARLRELWRASPPVMLTDRLVAPLVWRREDGTRLAFHCVIATWNTFDPFWAIDLHPADAATWTWLEITGRPSRSGNGV